ncbi:hypothetical protein [Micromonospora sp. NPDC126480]|uniref:hypothetical protein n=1 Tax=Micromonospora sp. NPDC126480 TaxID=3155312 RepID=UPI0033278CFF
MPEEDLTRADARGPRHGRHSSDRLTARRIRSTIPARTRGALRRLARSRRRRRWALEGVAALACLVALATYVQANDGPTPGVPDPGGVPAGVGRPSNLPGADGRDPASGQASPGLRPRQRPPSPSPTPSTPPPSPVLTLALREVPAEVDLTAVGSRDWVHWGLRGDGTSVRKRGGSGEIHDAGGRGRRGSWDGNQETFRWRDGNPVRSVDGSPHGSFTCGTGSGFTLAVAGSGDPRSVHVYAGTWRAKGRLDVRLSSGGPVRTLRLEDPHTSRSAEFAIRFQAPVGERLVVTWTTEHAFTDDCAGVTLQAVALR